MWQSWYPYDSFGLDACSWIVLSFAVWFSNLAVRKQSLFWGVTLYWSLLGVLCLIQRLFLDTNLFGSVFGLMRVLSWGLFLFGPLVCVCVQRHVIGWRRWSVNVLGSVLAIVGVDAFWIEPNTLEVTHYTIQDERISKPIRIVLLADIQTDIFNAHTQNALATAIKQNPDIVVFAGDYLQYSFRRDFSPNIEPFNKILKELNYDSVINIVVEGDVEAKLGDEWHQLFKGIPSHILDPSQIIQLEGMNVVGLTMEDSKNGIVPEVQNDLYTIVIGHNPNFSLLRPNGDLYLAGHTHGGQVQMFGMGPLITLSDVPRAQAEGFHVLDNESVLIVSRGIGMERYDAPRLRFLCNPEIVVLNLLPSN